MWTWFLNKLPCEENAHYLYIWMEWIAIGLVAPFILINRLCPKEIVIPFVEFNSCVLSNRIGWRWIIFINIPPSYNMKIKIVWKQIKVYHISPLVTSDVGKKRARDWTHMWSSCGIVLINTSAHIESMGVKTNVTS